MRAEGAARGDAVMLGSSWFSAQIIMVQRAGEVCYSYSADGVRASNACLSSCAIRAIAVCLSDVIGETLSETRPWARWERGDLRREKK